MGAGGHDPEFLRELFAGLGAVSVRRLFGGAGIFADGLMFALVYGGVVYLKTDADAVADFEREKCSPFSYATSEGTRALTSYWRLPDRLYDDPDEMAAWARRALATARQKRRPPRRARATVKSRRYA